MPSILGGVGVIGHVCRYAKISRPEGGSLHALGTRGCPGCLQLIEQVAATCGVSMSASACVCFDLFSSFLQSLSVEDCRNGD